MPAGAVGYLALHPWIVALVMGSLAVLAAVAVARDLRTGVASSFVRQYHVDGDPVGYTLCILGEVGIVVLGAAMVLHAFGIVGNPIAAIDAILPAFLRCTQEFCPP
jgi:hypothetical protein